ncbi:MULTISPECIES: hypothetical protein [Desulfovibrio]|uniref:hypothetical protein n=1 Tax=Desulfovibrio TaxID=872 RepID=UPI0026ECFB76|nr:MULTISPECIES: hypothetical protein [Desulfovibrio]MCI7617581.1 hypothetical protein [Desulfovibrio piger]MDY4808166.1 hypothetical protein [Desulfovibrio sp.]
MVRMESLDILVRQVLPQVLPCPRGMVLDTLKAVAKHFCEQAAAWRERLEETGLQGEADIPLSLPTGSRLVMILGVWLDGNRLLPDDYRAEGNSLCLRTVLPRECSVVVDAALCPSPMVRWHASRPCPARMSPGRMLPELRWHWNNTTKVWRGRVSGPCPGRRSS